MDFKQMVQEKRIEINERIMELRMWLDRNKGNQPWEVIDAVQNRIQELEEYLPNIEENLRGAMEYS